LKAKLSNGDVPSAFAGRKGEEGIFSLDRWEKAVPEGYGSLPERTAKGLRFSLTNIGFFAKLKLKSRGYGDE